MARSCEPPLDTEGSSQGQPAGRQTPSRCGKEPNPTNTPKGWEASSPLSRQMRAPQHQHPKQRTQLSCPDFWPPELQFNTFVLF